MSYIVNAAGMNHRKIPSIF